MAPPTRSRLVSPTIQRARVLDVDTVNYTLAVATEFTKKPLVGIAFATPYQHPNNGEGIYFMPEVGSICWLVEPSDGGMPFVMAWASIEDRRASHRNRKMGLNPGDIYLGTRDENSIILRRGGVVQLGSTPLAQRLYIPIDNLIHDLCQNYKLETLAGGLAWSVGRKEESVDGKRPASVTLQARAFAEDAKPVAYLQIGSHPQDRNAILSLSLCPDGSEGQSPLLTLSIGKNGLNLKTTKAGGATGVVNWDIAGTITFKSGDKVVVKPKLEVGSATYPAIIGSTDFDTWVTAVSNYCSVTAPALHKAQHLKSS